MRSLMLTSLVDSLTNRPDMQNAIRWLMRRDDYAGDVQRIGSQQTGFDAAVLQPSVAALVNVQSVEAVDTEMKRRAVKGNYHNDAIAGHELVVVRGDRRDVGTVTHKIMASLTLSVSSRNQCALDREGAMLNYEALPAWSVFRLNPKRKCRLKYSF